MIDKIRIKTNLSINDFVGYEKVNFLYLKHKIYKDNKKRIQKDFEKLNTFYFYDNGKYFVCNISKYSDKIFLEFNPNHMEFTEFIKVLKKYKGCKITRIDCQIDLINVNVSKIYQSIYKKFNNNMVIYRELNKLSGFRISKTNMLRVYDKKLELEGRGKKVVGAKEVTRIELQVRYFGNYEVTTDNLFDYLYKEDVFKNYSMLKVRPNISEKVFLEIKEYGLESYKQKMFRNKKNTIFNKQMEVKKYDLNELFRKSLEDYKNGVKKYTVVDDKPRIKLSKNQKGLLYMIYKEDTENIEFNKKIINDLELFTIKKLIYNSGNITNYGIEKIKKLILDKNELIDCLQEMQRFYF